MKNPPSRQSLELCAAVTLFLAAASPLAGAALHDPVVPDYESYYLGWEAEEFPDYSGLELGFIHGDDALLDAAVLESGTLYVMSAPGEQDFRTRVSFSGTLTALAVQPRAHLGSADRMLVSDENGLQAYSRDEAQNSYQHDATLSTAPGFKSSKDLQVMVLPGGATFLCALEPDGQTFITGVVNGDSFTGLSRFASPDPVQAWRAFQWDGVGRPEIGMQTSSGLMVSNYLGAPLLSQPIALTSTTPLVSSYTDTALGVDRLVWSAQDPANNHYLIHTIDNRYPQAQELPVDLGTMEPEAFAFANWTGSTNPDLIFTSAIAGHWYVLPHDANAAFPASCYDLAGLLNFPTLGTPSADQPYLAVGDIDLDGDDDLMATDDNSRVSAIRGSLIDGLEMMPQKPTIESDVSLNLVAEYGSNVFETLLVVKTSAPLIGTATSCRVEVFFSESELGVYAELENEAPQHSTYVSFGSNATFNVTASVQEGLRYQIRLTPVLHDSQTQTYEQVGPPKMVSFDIYNDELPAQGSGLIPFHIIDNGGGGSGLSGFPPKPNIGPGKCLSC